MMASHSEQARFLHRDRGAAILVGVAVVAAGLLFFGPRFTDPPSYFDFADQRRILGIPNFMDVVSNVPWAVIGTLGLLCVYRERAGPGRPFTENWERLAWGVLFAGIGLVAFGSAYFHLSRDPARLVWDRLPITIVLMSFFALMIGERVDMRTGRVLLVPLLAAGVSSALYWKYTESIGRGDARWYFLVQFFPVIAIPLMFRLFPPRYTQTPRLAVAMSLYALAKVVEWLDRPIFATTRIVSGHTLKHLAGAGAALLLLQVVQFRRPSTARRT